MFNNTTFLSVQDYPKPTILELFFLFCHSK